MGFRCSGDVAGSFFSENFFCAARLLVILGMNRDEDATLLYFSLIAFGLVLWYAQPDQRSRESPNPGADGSPTKCCYDGSSCDKGAQARNGQGTDTRQQPNRAADDTSSAGADGRSLGHLRFLFVSEIASASLIGKQHGNIIVGKSCASKLFDDGVGLSFCINET